MRRAIARWLQKRLATPSGKPPSGELAVRASEADGSDHLLISQGDSLELISGNQQAGYTIIAISPASALKLAKWILRTWWARGLWFGWKLSAWEWTIEVELEEKLLEQSARLQRQKHAARGQQT